MKLCRLAEFAALFVAVAPWGEAQDTGAIHGAVTDPSGLPVAGAEVKATLVSRGLERTAKSGEAGDFLLPLMPVGAYTLQIQSGGSSGSSAPASC
jgi:hypothetical protein